MFTKIPKDLKIIKSKDVGKFTFRQIIIIVAGLAVCVPIFFVLRYVTELGLRSSLLIMFVFTIPFLLATLYEKNGQPFEKVLMNVIRLFITRTKQRPYVPKNSYSLLIEQHELDNKIARIKRDKNTKGR
jgi:hypothetical protein